MAEGVADEARQHRATHRQRSLEVGKGQRVVEGEDDIAGRGRQQGQQHGTGRQAAQGLAHVGQMGSTQLAVDGPDRGREQCEAEGGYRWRRPRHSLKGRQDASAVDRAGLRLRLLKQQAAAGDIRLLFGDDLKL